MLEGKNSFQVVVPKQIHRWEGAVSHSGVRAVATVQERDRGDRTQSESWVWRAANRLEVQLPGRINRM